MAQANAGTPLIYAGLIHLVIGNLLIGILEGALLVKIFKTPRAKTISTLILANYISAWGGSFFLGFVIVPLFHPTLYTGWLLFWGLIVATYLLTLIIEYPFVLFTFKGVPQKRTKAIKASFLIQTISFFILFVWYGTFGFLFPGLTLYSQNNIVKPSQMSLPDNVTMYFISDKDGNVYGGDLKTQNWQKIYDLQSTNQNDNLYVAFPGSNTNTWNLMSTTSETPIKENVAPVVAITHLHTYALKDGGQSKQGKITWMNFNTGAQLGPATNSLWSFRSGFWASNGLSEFKEQAKNHPSEKRQIA